MTAAFTTTEIHVKKKIHTKKDLVKIETLFMCFGVDIMSLFFKYCGGLFHFISEAVHRADRLECTAP